MSETEETYWRYVARRFAEAPTRFREADPALQFISGILVYILGGLVVLLSIASIFRAALLVGVYVYIGGFLVFLFLGFLWVAYKDSRD